MPIEGHRAILPRRSLKRWLGAAAFLVTVVGPIAEVASAHELTIVPMKGSERSQLLPLIVPGTHLSLSPAEVDFGTFDLFFSSTRELAITNTTGRTLTLDLEPPTPRLSVEPSSLGLDPGESATLTLEWLPVLGGTLDEPLTILVSHDGVAMTARREVPLSGTVLSVLDVSPRSLDFGVIDRAATATRLLEVINLEAVETTVSILPSSSFIFVDLPEDQLLGPAGSATERKTYSITFNPVGLELDVDGDLVLIGTPAGGSSTPHLVSVVGKSSDLGTSGIFREHDEVDFSVVRPGSYTAVVPLWNRSAVDTVEVSFALSGGSHASLAPSDLVIGPGGQPTVEVTWTPVGDTTLSATLIASVSYPGVSEPVVNTKDVWGWSKSYPALPPSFDFGTTEVGSTAVLGVTLANPGAELMTVEFPGGGDFGVQPNDQTLGQVDVFGLSHPYHVSVAAGQSRTVSFLWTPTSVGSVNSPMSFRSWYSDVEQPDSNFLLPIHEQIPVSGTAIAAPAELVLRDPVSQQMLSGVDFGRLTLGTNPAPAIEVELANVGGLPLPSLAGISTDGFFNIVGGNGANCSLVRGNYFCFEPLVPDPTYLLAEELEGLGAGQSVSARVRLYPGLPEVYSDQLDIHYGSETLSIPIDAEVVPYLVDDPLAQALAAGEAPLKGAPPDDDEDEGGTFVIDVMAPRLARGLGIEQVFAGVGDLDNVNLFNGNLFMRIPIGGSYPVGGGLAYQLQLNYNSNVWDRWLQLQRGEREPVQFFAPQAGATAGVGWTLHFGRLCEPTDLDFLRSMSQKARDLSLCRTTEYKYFDPSGASHVFETHLHPDGESVATSPDLEAAQFLYTQDGSYLRMKRLGPTSREIHFPDGTIHLFEKKSHAAWGDFWPDEWRITQIRDRNGNQVNIRYEDRTDGSSGVQWRIDDGHRVHYVRFRDDPSDYYAYLIDKVELTKFGGGPRAVYSFGYTTRTVERLFDLHGQPPLSTSQVTVPLLSTLFLADGSRYAFDYFLGGGVTGQNTLRARSVDLPTGGRIEWSYGFYSQPTATACAANDILLRDRVSIPGVTSRIVRAEVREGETEGEILDHKRFSHGLAVGDSVPLDYCDKFPRPPTPGPGNDAAVPPEAESHTTVISPLAFDGDGEAERTSVTVHYFSAFPFSVNPGGPGLASGGWNGHEFGLPFTRNTLYDPVAEPGEEEFLSTRVYECGAIPLATLDSGFDDCTHLRSTYVRYVRSPGYHDPVEPSSALNPRVVVSRQVFEDDLDDDGVAHWVRTESSTFDGLGNFRDTETTASFGGSRRRKSFRNYNRDFELIPGDPFEPPEVWILDTFNRHWVRGWKRVDDSDVPLPRRGGELCWTLSETQKTLDRERTWADENPALKDLVVRYTYENGDRTKEEHFGGDVQGVDEGCGETLSDPQYTIDHTYANGVLATSAFDGTSYFTVDRTIDPSTGLIAAERDSGEVETTFTYDSMGRLTESRHAVLATRRFEYEVPKPTNSVDTPRVTIRQHTRNQPADTLTESEIAFDAIGRVFEEIELQPDGSRSKRRYTYTPRNLTASVTTQQAVTGFDASQRTIYTWDALGRITNGVLPDGNEQTLTYFGGRQTDLETFVGTTFDGGNPGTVSSTAVTLTRHLDAFGRIQQLVTPDHTTTLTYDSLDQVASSQRAGQTRTFVTDGRGFRTSEKLPEKTDDVIFGGYDALGNVGEVVDGANTLTFEYDEAGRVDKVEGNDDELKSFTYYGAGAGSAKGRLHTATRTHHLTAANTPGFPDVAGEWKVLETYEYGDDGLVNKRLTNVTDNDDQPIGNFEQGWTYHALGRIETTSYPSACQVDPEEPCYTTGRTVTYHYSSGRLTSVTAGNGMGASSITYHSNGMLHGVTHVGGMLDSYGVDPDNLQRVGSIDLANQEMQLGAHRYDGSGNLIQIGNRRYTYDGSSRLEAHYQLGVLRDSFAYDVLDNLISIGGEGQDVDPDTNRLDGVTYDASGNQISDSCADYTYDPLNLLRSHDQDPAPAGCSSDDTSWVNLYTADDRRILVGGTTTGFRWTLRDLDGKILSTFTSSGPGIQHAKDYTYRDGLPLATRAGGMTKHLHLDHLGSPRAISEPGDVTIRNFAPYGGLLTGSGGEDLGFTGHEHDQGGDTIYMLARTYSSERGRFLQVDPGRDTSSWSLYAYAGNNPLNAIDPDGRIVFKLIKSGVKLAIKGGDVAATFAGVIEDAKTLFDSNASIGDRLLAAASLASEVVSPVSLRDVKAGVAAGKRLAASLPDGVGDIKAAVGIGKRQTDRIPDKIYRGGRFNDSAIKDIRADPDGVSFRDSLSNPLPAPGQPPRPVLRPGKPFIEVETAKLPPGSVIYDNVPPGHVTVKATPQQIVNALSEERGGKFPR